MAKQRRANQERKRASERELVERAVEELRQGKAPAAYGELAVRYMQRLYNFLLHQTGDPAEAEDIVQETLCKGLQKLEQFEQRSSLYTWLCRIALNELHNRRRRQRPVSGLLGGRDGEGEQAAVPEPSTEETPESIAADREMWHRVRSALLLLPEEFRTAVNLVDLEGLSYKEAAEVMGVPEGTVKSRLNRGRRMLARMLLERSRQQPQEG